MQAVERANSQVIYHRSNEQKLGPFSPSCWVKEWQIYQSKSLWIKLLTAIVINDKVSGVKVQGNSQAFSVTQII